MRTQTLRCWINAQSSFWNTNSTTKLLNFWLLARRWLSNSSPTSPVKMYHSSAFLRSLLFWNISVLSLVLIIVSRGLKLVTHFLQEWLLLLSQVIFHMRCCLSVCRLVDYEQSLFFLGPSSKTPEIRKWPRAWLKARDGRGTTRERLAAKPEAAALVSLARVQLPLLNLKKTRDCSQSSRLVPSRLLFIIDHSLIAHNTPFLPPPNLA